MRSLASCLVLPVAAIVLALGFSACATGPQEIPAELSPAKFFQITQELVDKENWDEAVHYLDEFKTRYGASEEPAVKDRLLEGEYLMAQISYKRGKLVEARDAYAALLKKYEGVPEKASSPPQWIRVLCVKMLATLAKKLPPPVEGPQLPPASPAPETKP
jgi:outer membrane protein assembly factor BamD (BamD/ComL family)